MGDQIRRPEKPLNEAEIFDESEIRQQLEDAKKNLETIQSLKGWPKKKEKQIRDAYQDIARVGFLAYKNNFFDIAKDATNFIPLTATDQEGKSIRIDFLSDAFARLRNFSFLEVEKLCEQRARALHEAGSDTQKYHDVEKKYGEHAQSLLSDSQVSFLLWTVDEFLQDPDVISKLAPPLIWQQHLMSLAETCAMLGASNQTIFKVLDVLAKVPRTDNVTLRPTRSLAVEKIVRAQTGIPRLEYLEEEAQTGIPRLEYLEEEIDPASLPLTGPRVEEALDLLENKTYVAYRKEGSIHRVVNQNIAQTLYSILIRYYHLSVLGEGFFDSARMQKIFVAIEDHLSDKHRARLQEAIDTVREAEILQGVAKKAA